MKTEKIKKSGAKKKKPRNRMKTYMPEGPDLLACNVIHPLCRNP